MEDFVRKRKSRKASVIACHRSDAGLFCPCGSCDCNIMILFTFRFFSSSLNTFMRHRSAIAKTKRNSISVCHTSTSNPIIEKPILTHGDRIFCLPFAKARCENIKRNRKNRLLAFDLHAFQHTNRSDPEQQQEHKKLKFEW